jgi:hypothetical protein
VERKKPKPLNYQVPYRPGKHAHKRVGYSPEEQKRNDEQVEWLQRAVDAQVRRTR